MVRVTEAIFRGGKLELVEQLPLRENERVRVTVEMAEGEPSAVDRAAALERLRAGFDKLKLDTSGGLPTREQLHDRKFVP